MIETRNRTCNRASSLESASRVDVSPVQPGGDNDPQAVSNSLEQAPVTEGSTGPFRHRTLSSRTSNMRIAVLANGDWDPDWGRHELAQVDYLICADGGGSSALRSGRIPDLLVGDMDSVGPEELVFCREAGVRIERYPAEKDETDLELALRFARERAEKAGEREISLYGATGARPDHFLGNIALMLRLTKQGLTVKAKDPQHQLWVLKPGMREKIDGRAGDKLSLLVLSETAIVTTEGLYYPLDHDKLYQDSPRGVSNVFVSESAAVTVDEGWVLVILVWEKE